MAAADDNDLLLVELFDALDYVIKAFLLQHVVRREQIMASVLHEGEPVIELWVQTLRATIREHDSLGSERDLSLPMIDYTEWPFMVLRRRRSQC